MKRNKFFGRFKPTISILYRYYYSFVSIYIHFQLILKQSLFEEIKISFIELQNDNEFGNLHLIDSLLVAELAEQAVPLVVESLAMVVANWVVAYFQEIADFAMAATFLAVAAVKVDDCQAFALVASAVEELLKIISV